MGFGLSVKKETWTARPLGRSYTVAVAASSVRSRSSELACHVLNSWLSGGESEGSVTAVNSRYERCAIRF